MARSSVVLLLASFVSAPALADRLPLRHGTYVLRGTPCADPPFAAMREWDGIGMADPHSHACRARLLARAGTTYTLANSCIGTGVGPGARSSERLSVTLLPHGAMRIGRDTYDYCAPAALPASLRRRAVR